MEDEEFRRIYDLTKDSVYRTALTWVKNPADALDITQEVMVKLYRHKGEFADDSHVRQWLLRVTVNQSKDLLRSSWFSRRQETDLEKLQAADRSASDVLQMILSLPIKYRSVIYLHYYEGYSFTETASILRISEAAAKMRAKRARDMLRLEIEEED